MKPIDLPHAATPLTRSVVEGDAGGPPQGGPTEGPVGTPPNVVSMEEGEPLPENLRFEPTPLRVGEDTAGRRQLEKVKHRQIVALAAQGLSQTTIALKLDISTSTVAKVLYQEANREKLGKTADAFMFRGMQKQLAIQRLEECAEKAVQVLEDVIDDANAKHSDKIQAAKEILNRNYGAAVQVVKQEVHDPRVLSDEELIALIQQGN